MLVVENASLPDERRLLSTLRDLGEAVRALDGPALLIIGEVAALADIERPGDESGQAGLGFAGVSS